jgi:hypothetical protein
MDCAPARTRFIISGMVRLPLVLLTLSRLGSIACSAAAPPEKGGSGGSSSIGSGSVAGTGGGLIFTGLVVALFFALLLDSKLRGSNIYRTLIFLPSLVPVVAGATLWIWMLNGEFGMIARPPGCFNISRFG